MPNLQKYAELEICDECGRVGKLHPWNDGYMTIFACDFCHSPTYVNQDPEPFNIYQEV